MGAGAHTSGASAPDPAHARLASARVLAREESPTLEGALAGLALAGLMEQAGEAAQAGEQYAAVARRYSVFPREAALAGIAKIRVQAVQRCSDAVLLQRRKEILREAEQAMKVAAEGNGADATARYLIDTARLLADFGGGAADQLTAVGLAEQVARLSDAARPLKAEAALRRAILLAKLEKGEGRSARWLTWQPFMVIRKSGPKRRSLPFSIRFLPVTMPIRRHSRRWPNVIDRLSPSRNGGLEPPG